jgi:hypothetical protein
MTLESDWPSSLPACLSFPSRYLPSSTSSLIAAQAAAAAQVSIPSLASARLIAWEAAAMEPWKSLAWEIGASQYHYHHRHHHCQLD